MGCRIAIELNLDYIAICLSSHVIKSEIKFVSTTNSDPLAGISFTVDLKISQNERIAVVILHWLQSVWRDFPISHNSHQLHQGE